MTDKATIRQLAEEELKRANARYPKFNSMHEGYAVMFEELQETKEELDKAESAIAYMWEEGVRTDCAENTGNANRLLSKYATALIQEAIQVLAMAYKMEDYLNVRKVL